MLVWVILHYCKPKIAPFVVILAQFTYGLLWYFRLEDYQGNEDSRDVEVRILQLAIILNGVNYNSFKVNVFLLSPAILVPYLLVVNKTARISD